jgi:hypothetical protein
MPDPSILAFSYRWTRPRVCEARRASWRRRRNARVAAEPYEGAKPTDALLFHLEDEDYVRGEVVFRALKAAVAIRLVA